jgi:hypothetical protein
MANSGKTFLQIILRCAIFLCFASQAVLNMELIFLCSFSSTYVFSDSIYVGLYVGRLVKIMWKEISLEGLNKTA